MQARIIAPAFPRPWQHRWTAVDGPSTLPEKPGLVAISHGHGVLGSRYATSTHNLRERPIRIWSVQLDAQSALRARLELNLRRRHKLEVARACRATAAADTPGVARHNPALEMTASAGRLRHGIRARVARVESPHVHFLVGQLPHEPAVPVDEKRRGNPGDDDEALAPRRDALRNGHEPRPRRRPGV